MKFCEKCGNSMENDMKFCPKCGTKSTYFPENDNNTACVNENINVTSCENVPEEIISVPEDPKTNHEHKSMRKGMKVCMIVCLVFTVIYIIMGIADPHMYSATILFAIFSLMFLILAKSPKGNPYLFGKARGIKKWIFVLLCVVAWVVLTGLLQNSNSIEQSDLPYISKLPSQPTNAYDVVDYSDSTEKTSASINTTTESPMSTPTPTVMITDAPTATPTVTPTVTPDPTATVEPVMIKKGSKGEDVKTIQNNLIELGYLDGPADGDFGNKTQSAVEAFQRNKSLEVTGIITEKDKDALTKAINEYRAKQAQKAANRPNWIIEQFSPWDGSHFELEELIIKNLNDEKSYKHIETTYIDITDNERKSIVDGILIVLGSSKRVAIGDLFITVEFSAKNAFNGTVKNTAYGISSYDNNTISLIAIE